MNRTVFLFLVLACLGLCWGLTIPLTRVAVLAGYKPFGLMAWQLIIVTFFSTLILLVRKKPFPSLSKHLELFLAIAVFGTLIPGFFSYTAAGHLPAGITSIIIAFVPMFALPIAVMARLDRFSFVRLAGLIIGATAVILLSSTDALPRGVSWIFIAMALVAPFAYALEVNYLAWRGDSGLDAFSVLWGAGLISLVVTIPIAVLSGQWIDPIKPWEFADWAILVAGTAHCLTYAGYVWIVGQAGAVFASQVAYLVTAAGIVWSMIILGESYSLSVWAAFALMMVGITLVRPRESEPSVAAHKDA